MIFAEFEHIAAEGWRILRPWATPANAFTAAHDLIEHDPENDTGSIEEEYMALGSGLVLRDSIVSGTEEYLCMLIANDVKFVTSQYSKDCVKPLPPKSKGVLPPLYANRYSLLVARVRNGRNTELRDISSHTIDNALAWVHAGAARALIKHARRLTTVRDLFYNLRNIFKIASFYDAGKMYVAFDWDGTFDYQYIPSKTA